MSCATARNALMISATTLLLAGCASTTFDAPPAVLKITDSWGVAIHSSQPPYRVLSNTALYPTRPGNKDWARGALSDLNSFAHGCHQNWCWGVTAVPVVFAAWKNWRRLNQSSCTNRTTISCANAPWNEAFMKLYQATSALLGHAPLPLHVRVILIPTGDGYHATVRRKSSSAVPLELGFRFPTDQNEPGYPKQAEKALINAVVTVAYEFQHIEYAAGETHGPAQPLPSKTTKDEANSECWKLSVKALLTQWAGTELSFPKETSEAMHLTYAIAGQKPKFSNAAVIGPALLLHRLGNYLTDRYPAINGGTEVTIPARNTRARKALAWYCRAFSRYSGDILQQPMPIKRTGPRAAAQHRKPRSSS